MTDALLGWDTALFRLLNGELHSRVLDVIMPFVTKEENWRIHVARTY